MTRKLRLGDVLEEFCEYRTGGEEPEVLTLTERNGFVSQRERFNKRLATEDTTGYKLVYKGDVAYNPYLLWAGAIAQNRDWDPGIISPLYPTFHVREGYDARFVNDLLLSGEMISRYDTIAFGSVPRRRRTSVSDFLALEIPQMPSIGAQRQMADVLDQVRRVRSRRRQSISLLEELAESIFFDIFGDSLDNAEGWPIKSMADHMLEPPRNGISPSKGGTVEAKVLTLSAVTGQSFNGEAFKVSTFTEAPTLSKRVDSRDFLVCRGNASTRLVGRGFFPDRDMPDIAFPDTMIAVRIDQSFLMPTFLEYLWRTTSVRAQIEGGARTTNGTYKINQKVLESIRIPVPPLELQRAFDRGVQSLARRRQAQVRQSMILDELNDSLRQRFLSGNFDGAMQILANRDSANS